MSGYLLDTNALIALFWPAHQQHAVMRSWFVRHRGKRWATCPVTQTGFIRIVSNPAFSRDAVTPRDAATLLEGNLRADDHEFWPDDMSFAQATGFVGARLVGHQQVTDAYLLGLAVRRRGVLASFDAGISSLAEPESPTQKAFLLIR